MKFKINSETMETIDSLRNQIEEYSNTVDSIVEAIVGPYTKNLDKYVCFIRECLADGEKQVSNDELDDFCMNLSTLIYFASGTCEYLGIREDISKAIYKEIYNSTRSQSIGTVADKDSVAELSSQHEQLTSICYSRAYKIMKAKVESAQELLSSVKKVLSRRISEMELTNMQR